MEKHSAVGRLMPVRSMATEVQAHFGLGLETDFLFMWGITRPLIATANRTALLLILCCALPCITHAQNTQLTAAEAKNHVGESATVCGRVASAHFAEKAKGLPTFLNLDMPYPKQIFTILIWGKDKPKFGDAVRRFRYSKVCVSGEITSRHEIPEIVVTSPEQIRIQK